jgi:hypothetical protein
MPDTLKELSNFQAAYVDKASAYTKLVLGLGYAGFFTAWSGTKQHLSPMALIGSALCMTVSLVLYLVYEISQAGVMSYLTAQFAKMPMRSEPEVAEALQTYKAKEQKLTKQFMFIWPTIFLTTAVTGLAGAGILIYAFVAGLFRL